MLVGGADVEVGEVGSPTAAVVISPEERESESAAASGAGSGSGATLAATALAPGAAGP